MTTHNQKREKPVLYVLTGPAGQIYTDTLASTRVECWERGFWTVVGSLGEEWKRKYWKREQASIKAAEREGFVIRKGTFTLSHLVSPAKKKTRK